MENTIVGNQQLARSEAVKRSQKIGADSLNGCREHAQWIEHLMLEGRQFGLAELKRS
jgi:hypothetical protein